MTEPDRPSAREFAIQSDAAGSYQYVHQRDSWLGFGDREVGKHWRNPGTASNDLLLESLWHKLVDLAPEGVRPQLEQTFVVKQRDWAPQAQALSNPEYYAGHLIEFNVGFSDATLQYATFYERTCITPATTREVLGDALRMAYVSEFWRDTGELFIGDLGYLQDDVTDLSVGLSTLGDVWCLAHEASHLVLGHTVKAQPLDDHVLADLATWPDHELAADASATYLLLGEGRHDPAHQDSYEAWFGAHLALTTLFLGDKEPDQGSHDHPPITHRVRALMEQTAAAGLPPAISGLATEFEMMRELITATIEAVPEPGE